MLINTIFTRPENLKIGEKEYLIKTDFKTWIKFDLLIQDKEIDNVYVLYQLVKKLIFIDEPKEDIQEIFEALFSFYSMYKENKEYKGKQIKEQLYDFCKDWNFIFAAFMQLYQINLYEIDLHWFEFKALFDNLKGTRFNEIIDVRSTDINDVDDSRKKEFSYLKEYYSLSENKTKRRAKDIEEEIMRKIGSDKND